MAEMSRLSLAAQKAALDSFFPESKTILEQDNKITWVHTVMPSPLSANYKLKLHYSRDMGLRVYVLEPYPLKLADGATSLPHVYSNEEQLLCLYYPKDKEWNSNMLFAKTIVPWACEWLIHYEIWLATGIWHGGGVEHGTIAEKIAVSKKAKEQ